MKNILITLFIVFGFNLSVSAKTCVLSLAEPNDKVDRLLLSTFYKKDGTLIDDNIDLFRAANINEIRACFLNENYEEVLFIAHGMSQRTGLTDYSMPVFFDRVSGTKQLLYKRFFDNLANEMQSNRVLTKVRIAMCSLDFKQPTSPDMQVPLEEYKIHSTVDILARAVVSQGRILELSPKAKILSKLVKDDVTRITRSWLRKSIDPVKLQEYRRVLHQ